MLLNDKYWHAIYKDSFP